MRKVLITILVVIILSLSLSQLALAQEASFYLSPASGSYDVDQTFSVSLFIDSGGAAINAAQAKIYFPADRLKAVNISKGNSIFTLWTKEPVYSNSQGEISFGGGLPSPGFRGSTGRVIIVSFQGKKAGQANVSFGEEAILANDPWGTNLFSYSSGGTYFIGIPEEIPPEVPPERVSRGPKVTSPTHPQSDKWYRNRNPEFQWKLTSDIIGVSTALNEKSVFNPGNISEGVFSSKKYEEREDGIWYFHIKHKNNIGWGDITHFKVQTDTQSPNPFEITIDNEGDVTNPRPLLYFEAEDDMSGTSHYEVKIGVGEIFSVVEIQTNPFRMPYQAPGEHSLEVRAVDRAGNKTLASAQIPIETIPIPEITVCQDVFLAGEEILFIQGTALPNIDVLLFFNRDGKLVKEWNVFSDENGNWSLREEGLFKSGIYQIIARAKDSRGAISNPSEECVVKVILQGISIGPWIISYLTLTTIFIITFLIALIGLSYLLNRIKKTRKAIEKETKDLKEKFYKEYRELEEDIKDQLEALKEVGVRRELTGKEGKVEKRLLKDLADIEKVIREELKDIEEIK